MYITPEILRDYLSKTIDNIVIMGNIRQRFKDIRFYAEGEGHSPEYLYLPPEEIALPPGGYPFNAIVPRAPGAEPPMPPKETCIIYCPCAVGRMINLVRECFFAYNEWFRDIYETIALGKNMETILEKCYPILKNPVFIDDSSYRTLARLKDYPAKGFKDNEYTFMQQSGHHSADYIYAMLNSDVAVESSAISPRPIIHRFDFLAHRTLYSTIKIEGEIVGFLSCLELETEFTNGIMDVFESLTELMTLALSRESHMPSTRHKGLNNDLLLGILNGGIVDEELTKTAFAQMGLTRGAYFVSYITTNVNTVQNPYLLSRIMELLTVNLENRSFSVVEGSNMILVVNNRPSEELKEKLVRLIRFYLREFEVAVGISFGFEDPRHLPLYYDQALAATRLGPLLGNGAVIFEYGDVVGYDLVERFGDRDRRRSICHPALFALVRHDREKQTNLLPTLKTYIECMGDTGKAAERLYLHRNSMYYRLKQITDLTGIDLQDAHILSHIMLSLRIMTLDGDERFRGC